MNGALFDALVRHKRWYEEAIGPVTPNCTYFLSVRTTLGCHPTYLDFQDCVDKHTEEGQLRT